MPPVVIVVELLGEPGADVKERLADLMHRTLNWDTQLSGLNGVVVRLPTGTYSGQTELPLIELADSVKAQITADVWPEGAKVLVLRWLEWAESATA